MKFQPFSIHRVTGIAGRVLSLWAPLAVLFALAWPGWAAAQIPGKDLGTVSLVPGADVIDPVQEAARLEDVKTVKHRYMDVYLPHSMALGGAYRALADSNDAIYLNPAGLSQIPRYTLAANYQFNPEDSLHVAHASIVDSETAKPLSAGLAFMFIKNGRNAGDLMSFRLDFALGYEINKNFSIGGTLHYTNLTAPSLKTWNDFSADLGMLFKFGDFVSLAVTGQNLIPYGMERAPIRSAAGLRVGMPDLFNITFDCVQDWQTDRESLLKLIYSAGFEVRASQYFPFRLGYMYDTVVNRQFVSAGFSIVAPKFAIDFTYRQRIVEVMSERAFLIGFQVFL